MVTVQLDDKIARRLREIAEKEHRSVDEVLSALLDRYVEPITPAERAERLIAISGMLDDPVTDLSSTVRETMKEYYQKRYGDSD